MPYCRPLQAPIIFHILAVAADFRLAVAVEYLLSLPVTPSEILHARLSSQNITGSSINSKPQTPAEKILQEYI